MGSEIANYADDNHLYYEDKCYNVLKSVLENDMITATAWFDNNYCANPDNWISEYCIILSRDGQQSLSISHYDDVTMSLMASQITSLTIVYSTVYSGEDQRKHQSSASLAFVRGIHRGPVNSPHKWPVTRKMFPFDDVIMGTGNTVLSDTTIKVLAVTLDNRLKFDKHVSSLCMKASRQINALKRISNYLDENCRILIFKSFISSNFSYCPVSWMFCGKTNLDKLEKLQKGHCGSFFEIQALSLYDSLLKRGNCLPLYVYMNTLLRHWSVQMRPRS